MDEKKVRMEMEAAGQDQWLQDYNAIMTNVDRQRYRFRYGKAYHGLKGERREAELAKLGKLEEMEKVFTGQTYADDDYRQLEETDYQGLKLPHVKELVEEIERAGFGWERGGFNLSLHDPERPVLFDICSVSIPKLEEYISDTRLSKRKSKKLERLIEEYKRFVG